MNKKNIQNTLYIILIVLFILFNYCIVAYGHRQTYDIEDNNCTHMSSQLEGMFEKIGLPVILKTGSREDGVRHMWIRIGLAEIDSVSLLPVINTGYNINVVEYESFDEYEKAKKY